MNKFEYIFNNNDEINIDEIFMSLNDSISWEDCFWIGKILHKNNKYPQKVVEAFRKSKKLGLSFITNGDYYLDTILIEANINYQFKKYKDAINDFVILNSREVEYPNSLNKIYASCQINSLDNLKRIAFNPNFFFNRIEKIIDEDNSILSSKHTIFLEALKLIVNNHKKRNIDGVNTNAFINKAIEYELTECQEFIDFARYFDVNEIYNHKGEIISLDNLNPHKIIKDLKEALTLIEVYKTQNILNDKEKAKLKQKLQEQKVEFDLALENNEIASQLKEEEFQTQINQFRKEVEKFTSENNKININTGSIQEKLSKYKILVIGQGKSKDKELLGVAKNLGYDKNCFEFETNYNDIVSATAKIIQWSNKYIAIIFGEIPHMTKGVEGYSSFIAKVEAEEGYPFSVRALNKSEQLNLNKSSFKDALRKIELHFNAIDL